MTKLRVPGVGVSFFDKQINDNCYYVDKTGFIQQILNEKNIVQLYTRPRRFGKSLMLSMLKCFFEKSDHERRPLFNGLKVEKMGPEIWDHFGKYPVISLSFKDAKRSTFAEAVAMISDEMASCYKEFAYLVNKLDEVDQKCFQIIRNAEADNGVLAKSLKKLTQWVTEATGQTPIVLLDEYDVPLAAAQKNGYYAEMIDFIRTMFSAAFKDNPYLFRAILTGCLRVSKESIFTGMNNFSCFTVTSCLDDEYFGFTKEDVLKLLEYYGLTDKYEEVKRWYDGYSFGNRPVYNPWSLINVVKALINPHEIVPFKAYWGNTSGNDVIQELLESHPELKGDVEALMAGGIIDKPVNELLTYGDLDGSNDAVWSFLLYTGYLKSVGPGNGEFNQLLVIPNMEVQTIYRQRIISFFKEQTRTFDLEALYAALWAGEAEKVETILNEFLRRTISYHDNSEAYYHGLLTGFLGRLKIISNREAGEGRLDLRVDDFNSDNSIIIELKVAASLSLLPEKAAMALEQILAKNYQDGPLEDGQQSVLCYGIAFYKKRCKVVCKKVLTKY